MKRFLVTPFLILFCLSFVFPAWAGDTECNGHKLAWGKGIKEFPGLALYKKEGGIKYYQNPESSGDCDLTAGIKSSHVAYGFKNDKLYTRIVRIDTVGDFKKMHDHMVNLYGDPKEKMDGEIHIDRWIAENIKIKLKFNKVNMSMKMGMYYMPLAEKDDADPTKSKPRFSALGIINKD